VRNEYNWRTVRAWEHSTSNILWLEPPLCLSPQIYTLITHTLDPF